VFPVPAIRNVILNLETQSQCSMILEETNKKCDLLSSLIEKHFEPNEKVNGANKIFDFILLQWVGL